MSAQTKIEWCDRTASPWYGCQHVSPACDHCYAEAWAKRSGSVGWGPHAERKCSPTYGKKLKKWNDEAAAAGVNYKVFASFCDPLDNAVPIEWFVDYLEALRTTPNLTHLLLTKRIGNWRTRIDDAANYAYAYPDRTSVDFRSWLARWHEGMAPENVWIGATVINQDEADRDVPKLLTVPARVRFLSIEPMLGPLDLQMVAVPEQDDQLRRPWDFDGSKFNALQLHDEDRFHQPPAKLDWIIAGGESGPHARPMHPDWARSLRDQCAAAGVPFLFKQWGEWAPFWYRDDGEPKRSHTFDDGRRVHRIGKTNADRLLDGIEHNEFPEVRS